MREDCGDGVRLVALLADHLNAPPFFADKTPVLVDDECYGDGTDNVPSFMT